MKKPDQPIGIFGGSFDPIHFGHLRLALELQQMLALQSIRFVPCREPVHKTALFANAQHRLAMVQLAVQDLPQFICDDREMVRDTPSYMIETLQSLRKDFKNAPLCLILGADAIGGLSSWFQWRSLLDYAHIIAVKRPDFSLPQQDPLAAYIREHQIHDQNRLHQELAGSILMPPTRQLEIAATDIRAQIAAHQNAKYLLPDAVIAYIHQHGLYCHNT